ncbi:unnamed protein product [Musa acuminata subsp. burmannicoides]
MLVLLVLDQIDIICMISAFHHLFPNAGLAIPLFAWKRSYGRVLWSCPSSIITPETSSYLYAQTKTSPFIALQAMASHLVLTSRLTATSSSFFFFFFLCLVARHHLEAAEYTVGDADGWDTGINYLLWSNKYNFTVGDVLVFKYVQVQHNVYQVTEETYRSCDSSTGVTRTYDSGDDRVTLGEATSYWFICTISGHCQAGMRLAVSVGNSSSDGGGATSAAPSPPEQGNGAAGGRMGWWWKAWMLCLSLCLLTWLNCF